MTQSVEKMFDIALAPGDRVVSATTWDDFVLVVTERGAVFKIYRTGRFL